MKTGLSMTSHIKLPAAWVGALFGLLCATQLAAADSLSTLTYSGDQSALEAFDRELNAAGNDAAKLAALEARLLAVLRRSDATFAARQAAAQRLGLVLAHSAPKKNASDYKPLATMLTNERDSDLARLALEPAPGEAIDEIFATSLASTLGRTRLGIIDSIARRRAVSAVPALTQLLKDSDAATAAGAAHALGEIANPAAVAALHATPEPSPAAIVAAKLTAATRMPPGAALLMLREIEQRAQDPVHRAAALRLTLEIDRGASPAKIAEVLGGSNWSMKQVALEALSGTRAPNLTSTLVAKLNTWDAPTQSAVITALGRRGDASALNAIVAAATHADATVRTAALTALGFLPGSTETAQLLARAAAGSNSDEAKVARQSLARLSGANVNAAVLAGAERGEPALRAVFLEQLALRNQTEGVPLLIKTRADPDATVRGAAVAALGEIAPASEQHALLDWTLAATDEAEQTRALRALVNVTLRNPSAADRGRAVYDAIEQAKPEVALRLLPALARIGGEPSAAATARLAVRDDEKLSSAATDALVRWNDRVALPALATVAEKAARPEARQAALDGALRSLERSREAWTPASTAAIARLLEATKDAAVRKRLFAVLTRANDETAVALAEKLQSDATLGAEARDVADIVRANRAGRPKLRASSSESQLGNLLDGRTSTRWSAPAGVDEWVEVEFRKERPVRRITLDQTGRDAEFPERYEVYVMDDRAQRGAPVASGDGMRGKTVIELPAGTRGRIVLIKNTAERKDTPWAICELWVD